MHTTDTCTPHTRTLHTRTHLNTRTRRNTRTLGAHISLTDCCTLTHIQPCNSGSWSVFARAQTREHTHTHTHTHVYTHTRARARAHTFCSFCPSSLSSKVPRLTPTGETVCSGYFFSGAVQHRGSSHPVPACQTLLRHASPQTDRGRCLVADTASSQHLKGFSSWCTDTVFKTLLPVHNFIEWWERTDLCEDVSLPVKIFCDAVATCVFQCVRVRVRARVQADCGLCACARACPVFLYTCPKCGHASQSRFKSTVCVCVCVCVCLCVCAVSNFARRSSVTRIT